MSSDSVEKGKIKKGNFCWIRGAQGGREMRDALWYIFCVCKTNLFLIPLFFHFGINIGFEIPKEEFGKDKITQRKQIYLQNVNLKDLVDLRVFLFQLEDRTHDWLWGHAADTWMKKSNDWTAIWFCPWDFRTCPWDKDLSMICLGHFQLRSIPHFSS